MGFIEHFAQALGPRIRYGAPQRLLDLPEQTPPAADVHLADGGALTDLPLHELLIRKVKCITLFVITDASVKSSIDYDPWASGKPTPPDDEKGVSADVISYFGTFED